MQKFYSAENLILFIKFGMESKVFCISYFRHIESTTSSLQRMQMVTKMVAKNVKRIGKRSECK